MLSVVLGRRWFGPLGTVVTGVGIAGGGLFIGTALKLAKPLARKPWGVALAASCFGVIALGAFCAPAAVLAYSIGGYWDRMRDAPWRKVLQRALLPISVGFIVSGGYVLVF